jgi:hypothetical protein
MGVLIIWKRARIVSLRATSWRKMMKHRFIIAAATALAISAPALADSPVPLHQGSAAQPTFTPTTPPTSELAQAQIPAYPPALSGALLFPPPAP